MASFDPFAPPPQKKKRSGHTPPTPLWARRSQLVGPNGLIQISESEFYDILATGAVRAHKANNTQQTCCVFCVQDLLDYIEEHSIRRNADTTADTSAMTGAIALNGARQAAAKSARAAAEAAALALEEDEDLKDLLKDDED